MKPKKNRTPYLRIIRKNVEDLEVAKDQTVTEDLSEAVNDGEVTEDPIATAEDGDL